MKQYSIIGFVVMVAAILGLLYTHNLFSASPFVIAAQSAAAGLMIWARVTFGVRSFHAGASPTEGGLVTTGPYRRIRHPIYAAISLFCWAGIAGNLSLLSVAAGMVLLIGAWLRITSEEALLVVRYPEYKSYAAGTKRMIPFVY
jgi:protein-S-isoprenylcysteine O-methyltransferase Ste14